MQERYDEAEAALKRALAIDRRYKIAKNNLKFLAEARRTGPPKIMEIHDGWLEKIGDSFFSLFPHPL